MENAAVSERLLRWLQNRSHGAISIAPFAPGPAHVLERLGPERFRATWSDGFYNWSDLGAIAGAIPIAPFAPGPAHVLERLGPERFGAIQSMESLRIAPWGGGSAGSDPKYGTAPN